MSFGKKLAAAVAAAGAVVTAPIWIPAAAGVAVAAGTAVAGAAGAVATAATGAAGAVAGAAGSAMAAVGTGVGTAASAVGISAVGTVAGTTAGATAVGTIATSAAVGATSAVSGASKMKEASEIKGKAEDKYNEEREKFDKTESDTNQKLDDLSKLKLEIWSGFERYKTAFEKISNLDDLGSAKLEEKLKFDENQLENVTVLTVSAKDLIKDGILSATGGELAGLALSSGITSAATASTGTAIASLHGVAATNASLAALGGGSLASGGLGMAGGAVVANALAFAPAMAIGGLFLHGHGKKSLNSAEKVKEESEELVQSMQESEIELKKLQTLTESMKSKLDYFKGQYEMWTDRLEALVAKETDARKYTDAQLNVVLLSGQIVSILIDLTQTDLIETNKEEGTSEVRTKEVNAIIKEKDQEWNEALAS